MISIVPVQAPSTGTHPAFPAHDPTGNSEQDLAGFGMQDPAAKTDLAEKSSSAIIGIIKNFLIDLCAPQDE
jgi:hypothetical protein